MPQIPIKYPIATLAPNTTKPVVEPCITKISASGGRAYCIYLRDGTKITVGRNQNTEGQAWLTVSDQEVIKTL